MNTYHRAPLTTPVTPARTSVWLLAGVSIFAFMIGGLATVGLIEVASMVRGSPEPYVVQQPAAVTRSAATTLLSVPEEPPVVSAPAAIVPVVAETSIPSASAALADKEAKIAEAINIAHRNKMRMLTEGVVAGLYDVTVDDTESGSRIALNSYNAPSAADALRDILSAAARSGEIEVPQELATYDGQIDTQTLLFDLVQRSLAEGGEAEVAAAEEMSQRAFAASQAQTETVAGKRYYTVESGDSLAYIALQFYGSTRSYAQIYDANRDILESPDRILIGQRLIIPNV